MILLVVFKFLNKKVNFVRKNMGIFHFSAYLCFTIQLSV